MFPFLRHVSRAVQLDIDGPATWHSGMTQPALCCKQANEGAVLTCEV